MSETTVRVPDLPKATSLGTGDLLLCYQSGLKSVPASAVAGDVPTPSGHFYADQGSQVRRLADRLLVGAAADNPGLADRNHAPTDWLSSTMAATPIGAWPVWGAQSAVLARYGSIGLVAGSRTSDAKASTAMLGYQPSSIGIASWTIDDDVSSPRTTTGYAFYGEAWRMAGVTYQPVFVCELEAVNFGPPVGTPSPAHPNLGGGAVGLQIGAGGGQTSGTHEAAAAIVVVPNPNPFTRGVVFAKGSLSGLDANGNGYGEALSVPRGASIACYAGDDQVGLFVRSTATSGANQVRLESQDSGVVVSNAQGQQLFAMATAATATNSLYTQAGAGQQAAGLYVAEGTGGSPNLGLYPSTGGEIQTSGPVSNVGGTISATAGGGFLHINVNGVDLRIPLLTPAQAGG